MTTLSTDETPQRRKLSRKDITDLIGAVIPGMSLGFRNLGIYKAVGLDYDKDPDCTEEVPPSTAARGFSDSDLELMAAAHALSDGSPDVCEDCKAWFTSSELRQVTGKEVTDVEAAQEAVDFIWDLLVPPATFTDPVAVLTRLAEKSRAYEQTVKEGEEAEAEVETEEDRQYAADTCTLPAGVTEKCDDDWPWSLVGFPDYLKGIDAEHEPGMRSAGVRFVPVLDEEGEDTGEETMVSDTEFTAAAYWVLAALHKKYRGGIWGRWFFENWLQQWPHLVEMAGGSSGIEGTYDSLSSIDLDADDLLKDPMETFAWLTGLSDKSAWPDLHSPFGDKVVKDSVLTPDMLPPDIAGFASDEAERIGVSLSMLAGPCWAVMTTALNDCVKIQPREKDTGFVTSSRYWGLGLAPSASAKTAAINVAFEPLEIKQKQWIKEDNKLTGEWKLKLKRWERDSKGNEAIGPAPKKPLKRRTIIIAGTPESFIDTLSQNERGVAFKCDEVVSFLADDNYHKSNGAERALKLQLDNGGYYSADRKNEDLSREVQNLGASIFGFTQQRKFATIAAGLTSDGLLQRFQPFACSVTGIDIDRQPDATAKAAYHRRIDRLLDINTPQVVTLEPGAHVWRKRVDAAAKAIIAIPTFPDALHEHMGKWRGKYARILLAYHACTCDPDEWGILPPVPASTAKQVHDLFVRFFLPEAIDFYTQFFERTNEDVTQVRWVADYLLSREIKDITARDAKRAYKALKTDKDVQRVFGLLEKLGWVRPSADERSNSSKWHVNPLVHVRWSERGAAEKVRREKERASIEAAHKTLRDLQ